MKTLYCVSKSITSSLIKPIFLGMGLLICSIVAFGSPISQSPEGDLTPPGSAQSSGIDTLSKGYCVTMEMDSLLRKTYPKMGSLEDFEVFLQKEIALYNKRLQLKTANADEIITIPVIVHVIHNGENPGVGANISAEQVLSQIDAFTDHFRKRGTGSNNHQHGADIHIEFAPAIWDPDGNRMDEPGVDRYDGGREGWDRLPIQAILKGETIWDPNRYFNIWTVNFGGNSDGLLGYAQFPSGSGLDGLYEDEGPASTDGVVMNYRVFGTTSNVPRPYHEGKVASHEVGHWLGLRHIWGDGKCFLDDYCEDTPNASDAGWSKAFLGCPADDECGDGDRPVDNYMDYSDDPCKTTFTECQKIRMRTVMDVSPRRKELLNSQVHIEQDEPVAFFDANPLSTCVGSDIQFNDKSMNNPTNWQWLFIDSSSDTIGTSTDQDPVQQFNSPGQFDIVLNVSNSSGSGTLRRDNYLTILSDSERNEVFEDFEDPENRLIDWVVYNPDADKSFEVADVSAYGSGLHSMYFENSDEGSNPSGTMDALISPLMDISSLDNPYLIFHYAYAYTGNESQKDTLAIIYSNDCGETYIPLWSRSGENLATAPNTSTPFTPGAEDWDSVVVSLNTLTDIQQIHFALANISRGGNNIYIDNVFIGDLEGRSLPEPVTIRYSDSVICADGSVQFEDNTPQYPTNWLWSFEGGTPATSTLQNPVVKYDSPGKFDVTLEVGNAFGSSSHTFDTVITVINPIEVSLNSDKESYCPGEEIQLTASGADSYLWFDERSEDPVSDDNPYSLKLYQSRTYYVVGSVGACQDTASTYIEIDENTNVRVVPSDTTLCEPATITLVASGADSYIWLTKNDTLSTEASFEISVDSSLVIGLVGHIEGSCSGFDFAELVIFDKIPEVFEYGDVLYTEEGEEFQWFKDDVLIEGATSSEYSATQSGSYSVMVTYSSGCLAVSEAYQFWMTSIPQETSALEFSVYPNPSNGEFNISYPSTDKMEYVIIDLTGKTIKRGILSNDSGENTSTIVFSAKPGIYFIKVTDGKQMGVKKLMNH